MSQKAPPSAGWRSLMDGLVTAQAVLGGILAGGLAGYALGYLVPSTSSWAFLGGLLLGLVTGAVQAIRLATKKE